MVFSSGCSKLEFEIFGLKFPKEEVNDREDEDYPEAIIYDEKEEAVIDESEDYEKSFKAESDTFDISMQRKYFLEGIKYFEDKSYLLAEYYFNKLKDDYLILQDYTLYYLSKSLFMQEKYDSAEEYYIRLIEDYPHSIWQEKSHLEYADLFFLKEDYIKAEEQYTSFLIKFTSSPYYPYALFQLAECQEKNEKYTEAYSNYKKIWTEYPETYYSEFAFDSLGKLSEEKGMEKFIPTARQIYSRGEIFFKKYLYTDAIEEFGKILEEEYLDGLSLYLHSRTLFRLGMCYYNLRNYEKAKDYLIMGYEKFPNSNVSDDSLYFIGRAFTNLGSTDEALSHYQKLLDKFPQSKYADDSLYRMGRIYYFMEDFQNAAKSYKKIIDSYPDGDMFFDALWELGWVQYIESNFDSAKNNFSNLAHLSKSTSLKEKGLFWEAKCYQKLGDTEKAIDTYKKIFDIKSYSYYFFSSADLLKDFKVDVSIPEITKPDKSFLFFEMFEDVDKSSDNEKPKDTDNMDIENDSESIYIYSHIEKAKELIILELYQSASLEIEAGSGEIEDNPEGILELSTLFLESHDYGRSVNLIRKNFTKLKSNLSGPYKDYFYYLAYPYGYKDIVDKYSSTYNIEPLFTLAVIREESSFKPDAKSFAGALGLMQIMPPTGRGIAEKIDIYGFSEDLLVDTETNIEMGTFYLREMLDRFNQNKFYALGAYNGGPGNMNRWLSSWGDRDIDEFIETIPFDETRNYIRRVMGSYYFYKLLYY